MADNDASGAWPILTPGSRLAGIIKGLTNHCFTQNISGPHGFREEVFFTYLPIISLRRPMNPGA